jgi:hypothetical protein
LGFPTNSGQISLFGVLPAKRRPGIVLSSFLGPAGVLHHSRQFAHCAYVTGIGGRVQPVQIIEGVFPANKKCANKSRCGHCFLARFFTHTPHWNGSAR